MSAPRGQGAGDRDADLEALEQWFIPGTLSCDKAEELARLAREARDRADALAAEHEMDEIEIIDLNNGYDQLITRIAKLEAERDALAVERDEALKQKGYSDEAAHVYAVDLDAAIARNAVLAAENERLRAAARDYLAVTNHVVGPRYVVDARMALARLAGAAGAEGE